MKKINCLLLLLLLLQYAQAQTINAAEFFIDADPGPGNATPVAITPGATTSFTTTIPTGSLGGFHVVGIRVRDGAGKWGLYETRGFYISSSTANVSNMNAAEFFVDADPGPGNGTAIPVTSGAVASFTLPLSTTSMAAGFHFLAIRTRDAAGRWGLYETRGFYISGSTANVSTINAAEFFVDADPGPGNGTAIPVTSGAVASFTLPLSTTSMAAGFHFLAIRTRDAAGKWGLYETRGFYISSSTNNVSTINAAEFFIDADPGAGNGTPVTVTAGATTNFTIPVSTASLASGFHFLAIRTRDAAGKWGLYETRGFYISNAATNAAPIAAAEYFLDADPGVGNGSPLTVAIPGNTVTQNFSCLVPVGTPNGQHLVGIRVMGSDGKWGLFDLDTITVSAVLPLRFLSFTAVKNGTKATLNWQTDNEINTSHFVVERSMNGIDFTAIGTVSSANSAGMHEYMFDDVNPADGVNFYRLRQVDRDNRFEYSSIGRVLFSTAVSASVYPNPATDQVNIRSVRPGKWMLSVYDAAGKLVLQEWQSTAGDRLQLDTRRLTAGTYWLLLNNGLETIQAKFIRR